MTPVAHSYRDDWPEPPGDPLQRAVVLRLRAVPEGELTNVARALLRVRGLDYAGLEGKQRLENARRQVGRWAKGTKPDLPLSTISEIAAALGESPVKVLLYGNEDLAAVADAGRQAVRKSRGR
jgi:hypothetical protein